MTNKIICGGGTHFGVSDLKGNKYAFMNEIQNLLLMVKPLVEEQLGHEVNYLTAINYEFCIPVLQALNTPTGPSSHVIEAQINDEKLIKLHIITGTGDKNLQVVLEQALDVMSKKEDLLTTSQESDSLPESNTSQAEAAYDTQVSGFEFVQSQVISQSGVSSPLPDDSYTVEETSGYDEERKIDSIHIRVSSPYDLESGEDYARVEIDNLNEPQNIETTPIVLADESQILLGHEAINPIEVNNVEIEEKSNNAQTNEQEGSQTSNENDQDSSEEVQSNFTTNAAEKQDTESDLTSVSLEKEQEILLVKSEEESKLVKNEAEKEPELFVVNSEKIEEVVVITEQVVQKEVTFEEYHEVEKQPEPRNVQDTLSKQSSAINLEQSQLISQVSSENTTPSDSDTLGEPSQTKLTSNKQQRQREPSYASTFGDESECINAYSEFTTTRNASPINYDEQFKRRISPKLKRTTKSAAVQFNEQVDTSTQTTSPTKSKVIFKKIITKTRQPKIFRPKLAISDVKGNTYNFTKELERTIFLVKPLVEEKLGKLIEKVQILDYAYGKYK